jgi:hypothetical protein
MLAGGKAPVIFGSQAAVQLVARALAQLEHASVRGSDGARATALLEER